MQKGIDNLTKEEIYTIESALDIDIKTKEVTEYGIHGKISLRNIMILGI